MPNLIVEQFDNLWILACTFLVMLMQAGFLCLESGVVRSKNNINVATKNLIDFSVCGLCFSLFGFGLMFAESYLGLFGKHTDFLGFVHSADTKVVFLFQFMFCATAVTIISGAAAERMKLIAYILLAMVTATLIYPVFGHWVWGNLLDSSNYGWLGALGFYDFAGASVVHSTGGWLALATILVLKPRLGRFDSEHRFAEQNLVVTTLGVILLWVGWFGFNGGSTLAFNNEIPHILFNTLLSGYGGGCVLLVYAFWRGQSINVLHLGNGVLAGLVSVTASCPIISATAALVIGAVGGGLSLYFTLLLEKLKIDDVVGAVPVHLVGGIWGTICVALFGDLSLIASDDGRLIQLTIQLVGVLACAVWVFSTGYLFCQFLNYHGILRVSAYAEQVGLNLTEHNSPSELHELLHEMAEHESTGDYTTRILANPFTEVGLITKQYHNVLTRFVHVEQNLKTTQANLELMIQEKSDQLAENMSSLSKTSFEKTQLLNNLASDLGTPLKSILTFARFGIDDINLELSEQEFLKYFTSIDNQAQRLLDYLEGLVSLSEINLGDMCLEKKGMQVSLLIDEAVGTIKLLAQEKGIECEYFNLLKVDYIEGDRKRIYQVLMNILDNAVKYSPADGIIKITAEEIEDPNQARVVKISITDKGPGITKKAQKEIFKRYYQDNKSAQGQGTGLGLALSEEIIKAHQGRIIVESVVNFGATFSIIIPCRTPIDATNK